MSVSKFFMNEIALGEQCMTISDIEAGVEHLANAVAVAPNRESLLGVLQTTLPEPIMRAIVDKLPEVCMVRETDQIKEQKSASHLIILFVAFCRRCSST